MPKPKDTTTLFKYSRREKDMIEKNNQLYTRIDNLIREKYELESQYNVLKENFHILANIKIEKLAECITKNPG